MNENIRILLQDKDFLEDNMAKAIEAGQNSLPSDIPIGALVVDSNSLNVISICGNTREKLKDPTNHAEMAAIREASNSIGDWRLNDLIIFTTLEPCIMCAGALIQARIGALVFGASDPQYGAAGSIYNFFSDPRLMHNPLVAGGILADQCSNLLNEFFASRRQTEEI